MPKAKQPAPKKTFFARLRQWCLFILLAIAVHTAIDYWRHHERLGNALPSTLLADIDGRTWDLEKLSRDKPLVIYFWATWCSYCSVTSPSIDALPDDIQVLSIALKSGSSRELKNYLNDHSYDFATVNDDTGQISKLWGVAGTPAIAIIEQGEITSFTQGITTYPGIWLRYQLAKNS